MEKERQYRLKGHGTFGLRDGWIYKGLSAVEKNRRILSDREKGADELGVGANMVQAIRYWLLACGLLVDKKREGMEFTRLGRCIYEKDPYLEDINSLWFLHYELVSNAAQATTWYLFFNSLETEEFTRYELNQMLLHELLLYTGETKEDIALSSLENDTSVLLHMYIKERDHTYDPEDKTVSPFSVLGLLKQEGERFCKVMPSLDKISPYVLWYGMQDALQKSGELYSVQLETLFHAGGVGKILNLNRNALYELAEQLNADGRIALNRTAGLDMIYQHTHMSKGDIVDTYYNL